MSIDNDDIPAVIAALRIAAAHYLQEAIEARHRDTIKTGTALQRKIQVMRIAEQLVLHQGRVIGELNRAATSSLEDYRRVFREAQSVPDANPVDVEDA